MNPQNHQNQSFNNLLDGNCNCGYELNGTDGIVTSPNYTESENYPAKVNCIWFRRGNYSLHTQVSKEQIVSEFIDCLTAYK